MEGGCANRKKLIQFNSILFINLRDALYKTSNCAVQNNKDDCRTTAEYPVDADTLNQYFANISTDPQYLPPTPKLTVNKYTEFSTDQSVFRMLDTVKQTATGLDCIPSWFLRIAAYRYR